jgi:hypothetical protein
MAFDYDALRDDLAEMLKKLPDPYAPDTSEQVKVQILMLSAATEMAIAGLKIIHERGDGNDGVELLKGLAGALSSVIMNWSQQFSDPDEAARVLLNSVERRIDGEAKFVFQHETEIPEKDN